MCNMDCFNCSESDCVNDSITVEERNKSNEYDAAVRYNRKGKKEKGIYESARKYEQSEKGKARHKKYLESDKGKEAVKKYEQSEKRREYLKEYAKTESCKAAQKKYKQSEKGKAARKRIDQKRIESGKNAERCRAYYYRRKQKMLMELMESIQ